MEFALLLLLLAPVWGNIRSQEDGFTFDSPDELEIDLVQPPRRAPALYEAPVGKVFHLASPQFVNNIAKQQHNKSLPHWLVFSKKTGIFWGVPLPGDEGTVHITISSEIIELKVVSDSTTTPTKCNKNEDNTVLTLLIDKSIWAIKPKQRVVAINNIAKFFRLPQSAFTLKPQVEKDDITDSSVVLAGPGNLQSRTSKSTTNLKVQVGCEGRLWEETAQIVHNLKHQARDGTIAEVLGLPLIGWRVKTETRPALRSKRQAVDDFGSGDYDDEFYTDYEDYEEGDLGNVETDPPISRKPVEIEPTTTTVASSTHPHRHHHGEEFEIPLPEEPKAASPTTEAASPVEPGPTKIDIPKPNEALSYDTDYDYDAYEDEDDVESETIVPDLTQKVASSSESSEPGAEATSTTHSTTTSTSTTSEAPTTFEIIEDTEPPLYTVGANEDTTSASTSTTSESTTSTTTTTEAAMTTATSTVPQEPTTTLLSTSTTTEAETSTASSTTTTTTEAEPTTKTTTVRHVPSSTTEAIVTETTEPVFIPKNTKPYIEKRLQYKHVTAGKVFRYAIPKNTFKDAEDGYNLTLQVLDASEQPLSRTSWLQFNPARRELYGLPLEESVSNWAYIIRASDKEGAYEQDRLNIQVQQHRLTRVINHEFVLNLRIEKPQEYPHYVDWSLKVLRALGKVYGTNMSEITVRQINHTSEPVVFVWSNDSLPTSYCPRSETEELFKMLTANDRGDPSRELGLMLAPDLRVKKVLKRDLATCEQQPPVPVTPTTNFSPILRNPVDKVIAVEGELLIYKVKDDVFYDPEDVDPSMLNITLLTADLGPIPSSSWLQFDTKNREFYGIPRKTGRTEYFLMCVDTGGMSAKDSLEVVVQPALKTKHNVEFSMNIGVSYETFSTSAALQRKFVERLMEIFEEPSPGNFHFFPFKPKRELSLDTTVVSWFNKSLPLEYCPNEEIKQLEYLLHSERSLSSRVLRIMGPDFPISTAKVHHIGNCKAKPFVAPGPEQVDEKDQNAAAVPTEETVPPQADNAVLVTLVLPIIIIGIMLFVAFTAACILYRKRRMGKMNVEEDGRQSYGNKGIPVIFQEELEEKPEPGTKAPIILKDEKPPLAPPEYSKSGSVKLEDSEPYQPPPPFARAQDNGRQPRPKPTPTYRKPPPYVPP